LHHQAPELLTKAIRTPLRNVIFQYSEEQGIFHWFILSDEIPTKISSLGPLHLNLGSVCGNLGLWENAKLLFG